MGAVIAVTGEVKRQAIYESTADKAKPWQAVKSGENALSLNEVLEYAAGTTSQDANVFSRIHIDNKGNEIITPITDPFAPIFADGDILVVSRKGFARTGAVEMTGHVKGEQIFPISDEINLSDIIPNKKILKDDFYPLIAVIERENRESMTSYYKSFPLLKLLKGSYDEKLKDGDIIHIFSKKQIFNLPQTENKYKKVKADLATAHLEMAQGSGVTEDLKFDDYNEDDIAFSYPVLADYLLDNSVILNGSVRREGKYPVSENDITLENVISNAGGFAVEADKSAIEIITQDQDGKLRRVEYNLNEIPASDIKLKVSDKIRVTGKYGNENDKNVLIFGEVNNPGRYDLTEGDTLYKLILRAGGLTYDAYPEGTIFSRKRERESQAMRYKMAAGDLEKSLALALNKKEEIDIGQIDMVRNLASQLREIEPVGRITVESDPEILAVRSELDILLESGDKIYIPKRPLSVRVFGEVLSPASLQFRDGKSAREYIMQAGGYTYHADKSRVFVVYPDGSSQPVFAGSWTQSSVKIPPGSTIVVPKDPKPFDFVESAGKISGLLANIALTGIWLGDINGD